jgi:hypothetical protein
MDQRAGFDWSTLTMGQKGILISGLALLVNMFIPWWNSFDFLGIDVPGGSIGGFNNLGVLGGLLLIAALIWEGINIAGMRVQAPTALISAALAGAAALFVILRALIKPTGFSYGIGTWIGLILALALGYAAYVRFQESQLEQSPPAAPPPL